MQRLHHYPDIKAMFRRLLIATVVGILAALAVALFRHAMYLGEWLFLSNDSGSLVNAAGGLVWWRRLITPALGGLAAGTLLWAWQRHTRQRPHAPTDYMEALESDEGKFDTSSSLIKSTASLLVVVSGSAIGREGAMILLAALAASFFAQRFTPKDEWKLWIACGAAAGMASAYHAPLAGSLFIAEILFGTLMLASLGPVVIWLMDMSHRGFLRLKLSPPWQLALGGFIVGLLSLLTPAVWGNGYSVVQGFLLSPPSFAIIAGIFLCKLLAILASSGSGAPGGVFTPTLFIGLAVGILFANTWALVFPGNEAMAILLGVTGMATLLAATTHAPIMSTLMICEMTGQYTLLPGLLIACVLASVLSRTLRQDSIYRQHVAEHR